MALPQLKYTVNLTRLVYQFYEGLARTIENKRT